MMCRILFLLILSFILTYCATPSAPTGGPRDTQPPALVKTSPENYTKNFTSDKIEFYFDEHITLNPSFVKITPRVEEFKVTFKKNNITLDFKEKLRENTTYQINFGNKVLDINEGNPLASLIYIFSTGDYIDSLKIKGKVIMAEPKEKIPDNTIASIYNYTPKVDSLFKKTRPEYFAQVNSTGEFEINYLRLDTFSLFILNDNNLNYYYDLNTELVGFYDDNVVSSSDEEQNIEVVLFLPEPEEFKVSTNQRRSQNRRVLLEGNKSLSKDERVSFSVKDSVCLIKTSSIPFTNNYDVYFYPPCSATQKVYLIMNDSIVLDSLSITVVEQKVKPKFTFPKFIDATKDSVCINVDVPIARLNKLSILLLDTLNTDTTQLTISSFNDEGFCFQLIKNLPKETILHIPDSTLVFHERFYSDTITRFVNFFTEDNLGKLTIEVVNVDSNYGYIFYLLNDKGEIVERVYVFENQKIVFGKLLPKSYSIEIIEDKNRNQKRDMGSFKNKELPERIFIEEKPLLVKANWEIEHTIDIKNFE